MPLFGFLPYDDDEKRRRRALTPPISPNDPPARPPTLPNVPAPNPRPISLPAPRGIPGDIPNGPMPGSPRPSTLPELSPLPPDAHRALTATAPPIPDAPMAPLSRRPSRYEELGEAKDVYLKGTPGRFKSGVMGALRGAAAGLASGGGLGGALGGAVAGGAFGGIHPRGAREMEFNERIRPQIMERFAFEDADSAARMAAEKALREDRMSRANLANIHSQIGSRAAADALNQEKLDYERGKPTILSPGQTAIRPGERPGEYAPIFTAPPDPRQGVMTADEAAAALSAEEGTVEEVSQGSLRGRLESLKGRLTPDEQRLVFGGATSSDNQQAIARAQARWQKIQDDELQSIRRDTGERRKAKVSQRRYGRKGTPGRTAISVSEAADLLR